MIAFVGSVFSPYYAWSGRRDPLNHCAINVALYGRPGARWAMTERGRRSVARSEKVFRAGPSSLHWRNDVLEIHLDEIGAPVPRRSRGMIRVTPSGFTERSFSLDAAGRHVWQPIAPKARIDVMFDRPDLRWSGNGYLDSNHGSGPLEADFREWTWLRAHLGRDSVVFYDAQRRDGSLASLALRFEPDGRVQSVEPPPSVKIPSTLWRVARVTRADAGHAAVVRRTLEDAPFYARTELATRLFGEPAECIHESLSLDRVASPIVRAMLPFRMPRRIF